jgi:glycogen(starch) synthase
VNILFLCDEYPQCKHGGIGTVTQTLARELVKKGLNVSVQGFYPYYRKALPFEDDFGVKVYRYFYGNFLILKLSRHKLIGRVINIESKFNDYTGRLKQFIRVNNIDLIEIPDFNESFRYSGPKIIRFPDFGIPTVVKIHGTYSFINHLEKNGPFENTLFRKESLHIHSATKVVAVSIFARDIAEKIFNYSKKIDVLYNGISVSKSVTYLGDSAENNTIVFAGTLCEGKGVLSLLKAWEQVIKKLPSAKLLLYGKSGKNELLKIIRLISSESKESVQFKGFIKSDDLLSVYSYASLAIFPSYAENFSLAPMEAMKTGCPVIFTKRTSGKELIDNGIDGILVDPDNIKEISDAIIHLLTDKNSAQQIGEKGAEKIRKKFDISIIADQHIELYGSLADINK